MVNAIHGEHASKADHALDRLRRLCLALPETTERLSHGEPTWFVRGKKTFVMYADRHHDDRLAFWCAAPPGAQDVLVTSDPERYFIPPYVGHRGWLGVRLDVPVDWEEIAALVRDAYCEVAPKQLRARLEAQPEEQAYGEPLGYRLIMFVGTPGAGKSTVSRWLWEQLEGNGIPATLLPEEEVYPLEALQPFSKAHPRADPEDISLLLAGIRTLCTEWAASDSIWITDQFLPAFHWLVGLYSPDSVRAYAEDMRSIIAPLHPLLVVLEANVRKAWQRAVADRGQEWSDWMVDVFSQRNLPLYPGEPIHDVDTLLRFFEWGGNQSRSLLARWPVETVILNTETTPLAQVKETLLQHARTRRNQPGLEPIK